jgi:hypothetical protein
MPMDARKRIVPEHDPQSGGNLPLQVTEDHIQAPATRALVIPILDKRIRGILWTAYVVHWTNRSKRRERSAEFIEG